MKQIDDEEMKEMKEMKEMVSTLIDGECEDVGTALAKLSADPALQALWGDFYRLRAVMHSDYKPILTPDFNRQLQAAIAREAIPSPVADNPPSAAPAPSPREGSRRTQPTHAALKRPGRWRRPLVGFAIAATVAAVSIVSLNQLTDTQLGTTEGAIASLPPPSDTVITVPTQFEDGEVRRTAFDKTAIENNVGGSYWQTNGSTQRLDPLLEKRLNTYLADHMEHAGSAQVQGILPYSRLLGYDAQE